MEKSWDKRKINRKWKENIIFFKKKNVEERKGKVHDGQGPQRTDLV